MELLLENGEIVGENDNSFSIGQVLNQVKIFLREVAIHVIQVLDALQWMEELVEECLGQCRV